MTSRGRCVGQLESIFEEALRPPDSSRGNWHWTRPDDRYFARPLAHSRTALQDGLDVLAAVTPPDAFAADHAVLQAHYAAAIDLSQTDARTGEGRDRRAFLLAGVELQRLERISAARLSEAACTAFVGPLPFCWQPAIVPGGAYGASVNAAIRELAAPRLPGDGPPPLPHMTPEEDRALAEAGSRRASPTCAAPRRPCASCSRRRSFAPSTGSCWMRWRCSPAGW